MIRIAICDDSIASIEEVYNLVCQYACAHPENEFSVRRFHSVYDMLECIEDKTRHFNIYLLDILMPLLNGLDLGMQIRKTNAHAAIIYLTSTREYAFESFKTNPAGYLVKPVEREALFPILDRVCGQIEHMEDSIVLVRAKDGLISVRFNQIVYMEYVRHTIIFHLINGSTVCSMVMRESFTSFERNHVYGPRFIRPHASYIVNMDYAQSMTNTKFVLKGGEVPISKRVYAQVKRRYMEYMLSRNEVSVL